MGNDIQAGHEYGDTAPLWTVNGQNLNAHVNDAVIKPTFISSRTALSPLTLSPEIVINDAGVLKKTTIQELHDLLLYSGAIIQTVYEEYVNNVNLVIGIPIDDTIPQIGEGTEILSASITPRFATSDILIHFSGQACPGGAVASTSTVALFRNPGPSAIAANATTFGNPQHRNNLVLNYKDSPGTTSTLTYSIRAGANTGSGISIRFNGDATARDFGGASRATLILQEIKV